MGTNRRSVDEARDIIDLSPFEMFPFAVGFMPLDRYTLPFRRYRTLSHAKAAAKGLRDSTIYEFNFDNDTWEVME